MFADLLSRHDLSGTPQARRSRLSLTGQDGCATYPLCISAGALCGSLFLSLSFLLTLSANFLLDFLFEGLLIPRLRAEVNVIGGEK